MKLLATLIALTLSLPVFAAKTVVPFETLTPSSVLTLSVDSIDFRPDLTRLYGKLIGRPHTSHRVDAAVMLSGKSVLTSDDIDGVDFKRYFQWEDEGIIPVEIDFPAVKKFSAATVELDTPRGKSITRIKKASPKAVRKTTPRK